MKLGIAGFGKMGQDIFNLLFDKLREDRFVILEPYNTEKHAANLQKQLDRKHRRGLLTEQQLADRKQAVTFTADPGDFVGCDLVLEAIPEALAAKQTFETAFPDIPVYLVYENPYFKVSAGNCVTSEEAIVLLGKIRSQFPEAYLMREDLTVADLIR